MLNAGRYPPIASLSLDYIGSRKSGLKHLDVNDSGELATAALSNRVVDPYKGKRFPEIAGMDRILGHALHGIR